ncbi:hypothetical protein MATL_G00000010 [Megalops atlanticus]|uniref:Uncharacterized protein n=1 Tax=Megalops atlanticus TaxID=7932 RepID=A0A9D3TGT2_MEGAT|nr:hypothetical protein MATL_G00000010 [Megalops atlanticus]
MFLPKDAYLWRHSVEDRRLRTRPEGDPFVILGEGRGQQSNIAVRHPAWPEGSSCVPDNGIGCFLWSQATRWFRRPSHKVSRQHTQWNQAPGCSSKT